VRLVKTNVFRISISFAALFALVSAVSLLTVYRVTLEEIKSQSDRALKTEVKELQAIYDEGDLEEVIEIINFRNRASSLIHHRYALTFNDGTFLVGDENVLKSLGQNYQNPMSSEDKEYITEDDAHIPVKILFHPLSQDFQIVISESQYAFYELREHTLSGVMIAIAMTIILAVVIGYYMGHLVMLRINRINTGIQDSIASGFKNKLPLSKREDEFQALTVKLNAMLGQIERLISGMRQVTNNVAHDLRSPLTRMRSRLEVTLLNARDTEEYREAMEKTINDIGEVLKTFNAMLSIAQAQAGINRETPSTINISNLCEELAELYQAVAEEKQCELLWRTEEKLQVIGNRQLLAQAISNLLENAIKFSPPNTAVTLSATSEGNSAIITVGDNGIGIPEKDYESVFEPFHRLDSARSTPGSGLGLSLVKAVMDLHKGSISLHNNHPGLRVELRLTLI